MKYKLICCDLDGTLLDDNKKISNELIKGINELLERDILFIITTGRPFTSTKRYLDLFNKNIPVILYNGSVIRMSKTEDVLFQESLSLCDASKIIKIINDYNGTYMYWKNEVPFVNKIDDYIDSYVKVSKVPPHLDDKDYNNITKIIWFNDSEVLKEYEKTLFNDLENVNHFTSNPTFLEFVNKNASKEEAIKKVCALYNIKKEEVIAIGDGNNDIGMIKYSGLGVAMANSSEKVKNEADMVCPSNNDSGVLEIIKMVK